jgi:lipoprotein-anchoring transpeptidase ErfK/SrfK
MLKSVRTRSAVAGLAMGGASSSGRLRLRERDIVDLYERVHIDAPVYVVR